MPRACSSAAGAPGRVHKALPGLGRQGTPDAPEKPGKGESWDPQKPQRSQGGYSEQPTRWNDDA